MSSKFKINCNNCNIEFEINYDSPENEHTTYIICPKCKKQVYASSDFGFGPVWPANMYLGNKLLLTVTFLSDNHYEITYKSSLEKVIAIPKRYSKNNYQHHIKILEYIHKDIKELIDTIDTNVE